jgi:cytochrome c oxidase subunit I
LFIAGGLTGPILAQPALDTYLHNTYFVVAHFHLIMAMAGVFSIFAGVYYWFPLMSGRLMSETLGKFHFWITLLCAYAAFLPMHFAGLAGEPRQYSQLAGTTPALASLLPLQKYITYFALLLGAAQLLFLVNLLWSAFRGKPAGFNPWQATTLEWAPELSSATFVTSSPNPASHLKRKVFRGPYDYGLRPDGSDFIMQCHPDTNPE